MSISQSAIDSASSKVLKVASTMIGQIGKYRDPLINLESHEQLQESVDLIKGKTMLDTKAEHFLSAIDLLTSNSNQHGVILNEYAKMTEKLINPTALYKNFSVAIVGFGISGLLVAQECLVRGIQVQIFEAGEKVGGTWASKIYPGARCDVQGNLYTYAKNQVLFSSPYLSHEEIQSYLEYSVDKFGVSEYVNFESKVTGAIWDREASCWRLRVLDMKTGKQETQNHNVLISATGQLSRRNFPRIPNMDSYRGRIIHANHWPRELEIRNSTVSLIGSGATASQILPYLVEQNNKVNYVFRTPAYFINVPYYRKNFDSNWIELFRHSTLYRDTYRLIKFTDSIDGNLNAVQKNAGNDLRAQLIENMKNSIGNDDNKLQKCLPNYPLGAKRILLDDGTFFKSIRSPSVKLFKESNFAFTAKGMVFPDGTEVGSDYTIFATGFDSTKMFSEFEIKGLEFNLEEFWNEEPSAYLGMSVPGFPNMFMMFGPNTNVVVNGSNTFMAECQASYIAQACLFMIENSLRILDVKKEFVNDWENFVSNENTKYNWEQNEVSSWYVNKKGRVIANFPGSTSDYWKLTKRFEESHYERK